MLSEDTIVLEIEVTRETAEEVKALIAERLWEPNEGLRMILGAGISALATEVLRDPKTEQEKIIQLSQLLTRAEGRLAGTRFDLSEARDALKRWELSNGAIRELTVSLEQIIKRQNREIDELKECLMRQAIELEKLRAQLGEEPVEKHSRSETTPAVKRGWRLGSKGK